MMIEEIIKTFKEKGATDEDIKASLMQLKDDIDKFLSESKVEEEPVHEETETETEEEKMSKFYGI